MLACVFFFRPPFFFPLLPHRRPTPPKQRTLFFAMPAQARPSPHPPKETPALPSIHQGLCAFCGLATAVAPHKHCLHTNMPREQLIAAHAYSLLAPRSAKPQKQRLTTRGARYSTARVFPFFISRHVFPPFLSDQDLPTLQLRTPPPLLHLVSVDSTLTVCLKTFAPFFFTRHKHHTPPPVASNPLLGPFFSIIPAPATLATPKKDNPIRSLPAKKERRWW